MFFSNKSIMTIPSKILASKPPDAQKEIKIQMPVKTNPVYRARTNTFPLFFGLHYQHRSTFRLICDILYLAIYAHLLECIAVYAINYMYPNLLWETFGYTIPRILQILLVFHSIPVIGSLSRTVFGCRMSVFFTVG